MTKKKTTKRAGRSKPKQNPIPGTEQQVHPDIEEAANAYVEARDERIACTDAEVKAKQLLMQRLHKHEVKVYDYTDDDGEPRRIELVDVAENVKVKKRKIDAALASAEGK